MQAKLARWGNSLGLRIPAEVARDLGFREGQVVELTPRERALEISSAEPGRRYTAQGIPIYSLEELLAGMTAENVPDLLEWGPDLGSEIIDDEYSRGEITLDELLDRRVPRGR